MLGELKQLRSFLAVARQGNFTRAADELNMAQPTLTVQIQKLEAQLGLRLFDRNRRSVQLTPKAIALVPQIERIVTEMENLVVDARNEPTQLRGIVTVATLPSLAASILPQAIRQLNNSYPEITVRLKDAMATRTTDMARNGEVDFAISYKAHPENQLIWEHLLTDHFCALAAASFSSLKGRNISLNNLAKYPLVLPTKESSIRMRVHEVAHEQDITLNVAYEADYNSTVLALAADGLGVAILSELIADRENTQHLRKITISNPAVYREIGIVKRKGRRLSRQSQLLIDTLRKIAQ